MPLVRRSVADMIGHFSGYTDILVNPTDLTGSMGSGLAKAFATRWPLMVEEYQDLCKSGKIGLGMIHTYYDEKTKNTIINIPTKNDWRDISNPQDVEAGVVKLADYLRQRPYHTVAMPLLGGGTQRTDSADVPPMLNLHLESLSNIIHLSIRPERFATPPKYLGIIGSRAYKDYNRIELGVMDMLIELGLHYRDFEAVVSGGGRGVDQVGAGTGKPNDDKPNLAKENGLRAIVCHADWDRYGDSAGYVRNKTVADIGTHFIAFVGSISNGTKNTISLIKRYNDEANRIREAMKTYDKDDVFSRPMPIIPEKKHLYVCDISSICV